LKSDVTKCAAGRKQSIVNENVGWQPETSSFETGGFCLRHAGATPARCAATRRNVGAALRKVATWVRQQNRDSTA